MTASLLPLDETALERAARDEPEWLREHRALGFARFGSLEMPDAGSEVWKYVDLDFDITDFGLTADPEGSESADELFEAIGAVAGHARVVDGLTAAIENLAGPATFSTLATAARERSDDVQRVIHAGISPGLDKFAAAHSAFGTDGVFLGVPEKAAVAAPFYVDVQANTAGTVSFPRIAVHLAPGAEASLVVQLRSPHERRLVVVPRIEAVVGDNARLRLTVVQNWGYDTRGIAHARIITERDAGLRFAEAGIGGSLGRLQLDVELSGQGSVAEVVGAYLGEESQTLDYRYLVHHVGERTRSEMFLKGAVEDEALSVFTGMIRIEEEAQHTDAFQTNRNLILSEGASAQSVPNLEILANDVRCGHGSTVGPLDEEQRYYLMSRGLDPERADRLQVRGFFEEAIGRFPEPAATGPIRNWINAKYIKAQEEGRL